jgi:hypothetical protein
MTDKKDRVTIMLSPEITMQIRREQADLIVESESSVSFSRVIEALCKKGLNAKGDLDLG